MQGPLSGVFNREPVSGSTESLTRGLPTGVTAIDTLTPIGKGQSMLVVGPRGVGRTDVALDAVQVHLFTLSVVVVLVVWFKCNLLGASGARRSVRVGVSSWPGGCRARGPRRKGRAR